MRIKQARRERGRAIWFHIVACKACSVEWPSDPALQVACDECQARPGERCTWRSRRGYTYHIGRDFQAMRDGYLTACDALTWDGRHSRHEILVCDEPLPAHLASASANHQPVQLALF
ncbi:MAG: hypothetical protein ACRYF2_17650 [Janthinobacterium lividum]